MEKDAKDNMKKAFQKAILHYHPDKSEPEKNGMKWKVLTEEITKFLTKRYECFKFNTNWIIMILTSKNISKNRVKINIVLKSKIMLHV